ncbi:MAG TPA: HAD-IIB family hydrolase [Microbacterium sp.]|nr:HAD-IIB family hydrolase [Microbacterium sp.]
MTTAQPLVVAFDLDDTLAPSKSPVDARVAQQLVDLARRVEVAIISGGQIAQFRAQVVDRLPDAADALAHVHLLPTCGTQYYRHDGSDFRGLYSRDLTDDEKTRALTAIEQEAKRLGYWETETWGDILEDRGSQITFSALGQSAPVDAKKAWDPTSEKKSALRDAVQARVPDLEVRSGGSTSIDITRKGIDKAYGMRQLAEQTGISPDDMLFYGDRLDVDGNDYPVRAMGIACVEVTSWEDTADKLDVLLAELPER